MVNRRPFEDCPKRRPEFILPEAPEDSRLAILGFRFLQGVVLFGPPAERLEPDQLKCMTRALLGQPKTEISRRVGITPKKVDLALVAARDVLGVGGNRYKVMSAGLMDGTMEIDEYGDPDLFPADKESLTILGRAIEGKTSAEVAHELGTGVDKRNIDLHMSRSFGDMGFTRRELQIAAALITGQISPETSRPIIPPLPYQTPAVG